ncbi:MAG: ATP-binding cassette domain-containing protein [Actinomycetota bacterium]|jgi:branched-chain amino acid transport system ATP-binding protein|nr:ATP-binding cassette domain-containing protein [Actinomycetota bacterium]
MTAPPGPAQAMLELRSVSAVYGPYRALFEVSLTVPAGAVVALLGPNGAGKSTVARVASGLVRPTAGRVLLDSVDVTGWPAYRIARRGLLHVPEGRAVFGSLTVQENLRVGLAARVGRRALGAAIDRAWTSFPLLADRRNQLAGTLSGGQQRVLSLAKALAAAPALLVVDELSLGLAPAMVDAVYGGLQDARDAGTTLLVVEQQVDRALELADAAVILAHGSVSWAGPAAEAAAEAASLLDATSGSDDSDGGRPQEADDLPAGQGLVNGP